MQLSQKTRKTVYLIYGAVLSLLLLVIGGMLIAACLRIYGQGESPFTRESIANALRALRIPAFFLLDMLLAGILLSVVLPIDEGRPRAIREESHLLARLKARTGETGKSKESKKRTVIRAVTAAVVILSFVYPAYYLLVPAHFTLEHLQECIVHTAVATLAASAVSAIALFVATLLLSGSYRREIEESKALLSMQEQSPVERVPQESRISPVKRLGSLLSSHEKPLLLTARLLLLTVAILLIVLGVLNGGARDVLAKAARICTECIGLG